MPVSGASRSGALHGWGRTAPTVADVLHPADAAEVSRAVLSAPGRGVLARGLGRSYGDAAQLAGGRVVSSTRLRGMELDVARGMLLAGAGCGLDAVLAEIVPRGWFVPVTPGTRFVSLGGAVAADVHGKNHHVDGSIGRHLEWLELVDGLGRLRRLSPDDGGEEFWATVAGMGLTGIITRVAVRLRPIETAWMTVDTVRAPDLDTVMDTLREHDRGFRYTVAWVDLSSGGRATGRGVVTSGEHATGGQVAAQLRGGDALRYAASARWVVPRLPVGLVGPGAIRAFNAAWYRRSPRAEHARPQRLEAFFHPLDGVREWNRLYGPNGFLQYQLVVPDGAGAVLRHVVERLRGAGVPCALAVLKRFGPADPAPLSFPRPGWTLAVDLPVRRDRELSALLDGLDARVAGAGGAVYLAKDSRLRPDLLAAMYPELDRWRRFRARLDPAQRFGSDLARRLGL